MIHYLLSISAIFVYIHAKTIPDQALVETFRIAFISDDDYKTNDSQYRTAKVSMDWMNNFTTLEWETEIMLIPHNESAQYSDLVLFNNDLYTVEDKTGNVIKFTGGRMSHFTKLYPTADNSPDGTKGMKAEWCTTKGNDLLCGSTGRLSNEEGQPMNDQQFVKFIDSCGNVTTFDWEPYYRKVMEAVSIQSPGYVKNEAIRWSKIRKEWVILPRYFIYPSNTIRPVSSQNIIIASENFSNLTVINVTGLANGTEENPTGFSCFEFIPETNDTILLAVRTTEFNQTTLRSDSTLVLINIYGEKLFPEIAISHDRKIEGCEILGKVDQISRSSGITFKWITMIILLYEVLL